MDLSKFHNPYDFANPVSDQALFAGRKEELENIRYYLDHARTAPKPINIALIGARASGKTSLLNICEIEAKKREFCTVRIDLDESDVETHMAFFYKLFDSIFCSVCDFGAFEGMEGKTYETYFSIINTYNIPEKKTFCTFSFPLEYAMAMNSGNTNKKLSDHNYKKDLIKFTEELKRPIILLFDECNVLAKSREILQKLRNIFMNLPGYMMVFTGTNELFPVMDEVFSPIIRQFKKINVTQFKDEKETEECIIKPLEKLRINFIDLIDWETFFDIKEIHKLSAGKPYEIQLICHKLFERVQTKKALKMKLDIGILEDVRKELEATQDIYKRPILIKIKNLKKEQLKSMALICSCEGNASFEQLWQIEYFLNGQENWIKDELRKELDYFIKEELFKIKDEIITFAGDEFDKIYTKYFARGQDIELSFSETSLEEKWFRVVKFTFNRVYLPNESNQTPILALPNIDINNFISKISDINSKEDIFSGSSSILADLYFLMLNYRYKNSIPAIKIFLTIPDIELTRYFCYKEPIDYSDNNITIDLHTTRIFEERAAEIGGTFLIQKNDFVVIPYERLIKKVENTGNESLKHFIIDQHTMRMTQEYTEKRNCKEAIFHAQLVYKYNNDNNLSPVINNNLGYLFMSEGNLDKARDLFQKAINEYREAEQLSLPNYNLGILEAKCGNFDKALSQINLCIEQIGNIEKEKRVMLCLFIPKVIDSELKFEELKEEIEVNDKASEYWKDRVKNKKNSNIQLGDKEKTQILQQLYKNLNLKKYFLDKGYIELKGVDLLETALKAKEALLLYME